MSFMQGTSQLMRVCDRQRAYKGTISLNESLNDGIRHIQHFYGYINHTLGDMERLLGLCEWERGNWPVVRKPARSITCCS